MKDRVVVETACPACGAQPGERCWHDPDPYHPARYQTSIVHSARVQAWRRAT